MTAHSHVPTRRTVLAGALGVGALGSVASSGAANAALGDPSVPTDPDVAFFLAIPDVAGQATTRGFEGQIELLTWAWGVDTPATTGGSGGGGGASRPNPRDVIVLAESGPQSPTLLLDTNTGRHVPSALITCVRNVKRPFTFMTLKFEDVLVTSYAVTPDPTDGHPLDLVHLVFSKVTQTFVPQNQDGSAGTPITTSFDYERNVSG